MQERINHFLNGRYPLFLADLRGWMYFSLLIPIIALGLILFQPFGLTYWHEYHKWIVECGYAFTVTGTYVLVYVIRFYFFPAYHQPDNWTRRKEIQNLLFYIPMLVLNTWIYALLSVEEIKFTWESFYNLQKCNGCIVLFTAISFCPFISLKFNTPSFTNVKPKSTSYPTEEQALNIIQQLNELMETRQLYLSKKCNERQIAGLCGYSIHQISYVLNNFSATSFSDFVNKYRVEHACRILQNGKDQKLKLEAVGYDCGFGSKAIFYAAFRKITGQTPAEYLADIQNQ